MRYVTATTEQEALTVLKGGDVRVVAGGTDLFPALNDQAVLPPALDISALAAFNGITRTASGWRIGAATPWRDIIRADLPAMFHGLQAAAREVGSVQIQARGTIGGNICNASPAADGVPPLLTLDAGVDLISENGCRQVPLSDFLLGVRQTDLRPGELLRSIVIPDLPDHCLSGFEKLGARRYLVISIAMVSALVVPDGCGGFSDARIAVGACSAVARRLTRLEELVVSAQRAEFLEEIYSGHFTALSPIGDVRASGAYRMRVSETLVRRMLTGFLKEGACG